MASKIMGMYIHLRGNASAIKEQYLKLKDVYHQLGGTLYPSICYKELMELCELYSEIAPVEDLPLLLPPDGDGYAPGNC